MREGGRWSISFATSRRNRRREEGRWSREGEECLILRTVRDEGRWSRD